MFIHQRTIPTGLSVTYALTSFLVDLYVPNGIPGAYALGNQMQNGALNIRYVGRADEDINNRLQSWVGSYTHFQFVSFSTKKDAFEKECELYHTFNPPDNKIHPAKPAGTRYSCLYGD